MIIWHDLNSNIDLNLLTQTANSYDFRAIVKKNFEILKYIWWNETDFQTRTFTVIVVKCVSVCVWGGGGTWHLRLPTFWLEGQVPLPTPTPPEPMPWAQNGLDVDEPLSPKKNKQTGAHSWIRPCLDPATRVVLLWVVWLCTSPITCCWFLLPHHNFAWVYKHGVYSSMGYPSVFISCYCIL